jgi:signal transduction histidine kinase
MLDGQRPRLLTDARRRAWWIGGIVALAAMSAVGVWMMLQRRRRARELDQLRRRLARDLHDEIGSNLAAIARLSELGAGQEPANSTAAGDWQEVNHIARESMDGMREVLWLAGAREEAGPDLASHLKRLVERMLGGVEVRWTAPLDALPSNWQPAARRELFLMVKEALTNVVRHAQATLVELGLAVNGTELRLEICDHGRGFDPATVQGGMGLASLRERARTLGGKLVIESVPGTGTTIHFTVPVAKLQPSAAGSTRTANVDSRS